MGSSTCSISATGRVLLYVSVVPPGIRTEQNEQGISNKGLFSFFRLQLFFFLAFQRSLIVYPAPSPGRRQRHAQCPAGSRRRDTSFLADPSPAARLSPGRGLCAPCHRISGASSPRYTGPDARYPRCARWPAKAPCRAEPRPARAASYQPILCTRASTSYLHPSECQDAYPAR